MRARTTLWLPTVSMLLLSLISYMDRSVLAILSPTILRDLHLSATEYGAAISVFSICYMIANPIWGLWMDKHGIFATAILAVAIWTLAAGAHAFIGHWFLPGILGLCLGRGLLGFGEGATFPAGLKTVTETGDFDVMIGDKKAVFTYTGAPGNRKDSNAASSHLSHPPR